MSQLVVFQEQAHTCHSILKLDRSIIVKMKKEGVEREQIKMESDIVTVKRISITHKHLVAVRRSTVKGQHEDAGGWWRRTWCPRTSGGDS